jgi:hypothetical protein
MTAWIRSRIAVVLALALLVPACAKYHYQAATRKGPPTSSVTIRLVMKNGVCTKEAPVQALYGLADTVVTWKVTNDCDSDITLTVNRVHEKASQWPGHGVYPFKEPKIEYSITRNSTVDVTATVKRSVDVKPSDRGFHVYTYGIRLRPGTEEDPEIIIEWP